MNGIKEKDVKRLWVEKDAVCVELKDGRIGRELIRDYEPLRKATRKQLENCRVDCDGVWFDDLDEGLELSGFFSPEKLDVPFEESEWFKSLETTPAEMIVANRDLRNWSQVTLAEKLGIQVQNLCAMENGRRTVSRKMAVKLGKIFGTDPAAFFDFGK